MSYDLEIYFRNPDFPMEEWREILSWFDAIERIVDPTINGRSPLLGKQWFIPADGYGVFCGVYGYHASYPFRDTKAHWEASIGTGSGYGLRQFIGYGLCYCVLSLIPETSAWDCGGYMDTLYQKPDNFLRKVNALIAANSLYESHTRRLEMQKMGVMDENFQLIPDPQVLKLAARSSSSEA